MSLSPISSLSNSLASALPRVASPSQGPSGAFEINAREYGPVAATVISAGQLAGDAAQTLCHFSTEGLARLGRGAEEVLDDTVDAVSDGASAVVDAVSDGARAVVGGVEKGLDAVGDAAHALYEGTGDALQSLAGYATLGVAAGRRMINETA